MLLKQFAMMKGQNQMYKVKATKDSQPIYPTSLEVNSNGEIYAIWYKSGSRAHVDWDFTKDLDLFEIVKE
jgi:hypothetical protein